MFGLFKKKNESNRDRLRKDFQHVVQQVKLVELERQVLVGQGIQEAENSFLKNYSKKSFQDAPFAEQMKQIEFVRGMEDLLGKGEGPVRILGIGYALFNKWQAALMLSDAEMIKEFECDLECLKLLADSYSV